MAKRKIVLSLMTQDQEFQALQAAEGVAAADREGLERETVFARNNGSLQAEQLYHFINVPEAARPAAIIVQTVAGDGLPNVARAAVKAGIGWVLLNRDAEYIARLKDEFPHLPIGVVTTDQVGIGRIHGQQIRSLVPRGGGILYVQGPPDTSAARERLKGFQDAVQGLPIDLRIVNGEWTEVTAERAVRSWLRLSGSRDFPLDGVVAQNDAMAAGARKELIAARPDWANRPYIGCDGLKEGGQKLVGEKTLAATVVVPPTAGVAVNLVAAQLRTGISTQARTVVAPRPYPPTV